MDPDSDACSQYQQACHAASQAFSVSIIAVVFTACQQHEPKIVVVPGNKKHPAGDSPITAIKKVIPPKKIGKTIYLSFDDGPNKGTRNMMHIIKEEAVPVTLFIIGEQVYYGKEQRALFDSLSHSPYFEIANHSYTHAFHNHYARFYQEPEAVINDFKRCADSLHLSSQIIRTPGRNIWRVGNINSTDLKASKATADSLAAVGYTEMGWDLEWQFDDQNKLKFGADEMLDRIDKFFITHLNRTDGHLVLLAHDQTFADAADSSELSQLIKKLKAKNCYEFETVNKYPGVNR
ncbi:MAG: polysaccharide deacetylase family protein [Chitinophagaceae bacterium]